MSKQKNKSQPKHGGTRTAEARERDTEQSERMVDDVRVEASSRPERGRGDTDRKAKARNERRR